MNGSGEHAWILTIDNGFVYTQQLLGFYNTRVMCPQSFLYVKKGGIEKLQVWYYTLSHEFGLDGVLKAQQKE